MKTLIDDRYYKELTEANPATICKNTGCRYDKESKTYSLTVWGNEFVINPPLKCVENITNTYKAHDYFALFIVYYLLNAKEIIMENNWVSEKDIPGGAAFFRGPHEIPTGKISEHFNNRMDAFNRVCTDAGGIEIEKADAAFYFQITPRIPVLVLLWNGDEDFPPEAKIMYDRSIGELLSLDIIFALAVAICDRLGKAEAETTIPVLTNGNNIDQYIGQMVTLKGRVTNTKIASIFDIDVESCDPDLRGSEAEVTGILHKEIITEDALNKKYEETGLFANRGPGVFYSLRRPDSSLLSHVTTENGNQT